MNVWKFSITTNPQDNEINATSPINPTYIVLVENTCLHAVEPIAMANTKHKYYKYYTSPGVPQTNLLKELTILLTFEQLFSVHFPGWLHLISQLSLCTFYFCQSLYSIWLHVYLSRKLKVVIEFDCTFPFIIIVKSLELDSQHMR